MKLKDKMIACMVIVFALFSLALGVALYGAQSVSARFTDFLEKDQAFLSNANTLYAQGLQMGQALRNVILAPNNQQGFKNHAAAREAFGKALDASRAMVAPTTEEGKVLARIAELSTKQAALQDRILVLLKDDQAQAIEILNKDETPVWRQMRADLLDLIKHENGDVESARAEIDKSTRTARLATLILAALAIVVGGGVAFWVTRDMLGQLGGEPAYAAEVAGRIAGGDLTAVIRVDNESNENSLMYAMRTMQASLAGLVSQVRNDTDTIATASNEIAAGNLDLSQRTEEQASSLEETASAMEELTSTVKQNADNARQANQLAVSASEVASQGGAVVADVVNTMASINESSKKIVDIISVIDGIAFQTNILALNAAVEAARAGEQGRGFAVVATEVRSLAQRSAAAAKEIKALIGASVEKVEAGTRLVDQAGSTMNDVVASVRRVTDIMGEISAASQEQTDGIGQVNLAITQMDQVTQQNAALVEEAAAAADSMRERAQQLSGLVSRFQL